MSAFACMLYRMVFRPMVLFTDKNWVLPHMAEVSYVYGRNGAFLLQPGSRRSVDFLANCYETRGFCFIIVT